VRQQRIPHPLSGRGCEFDQLTNQFCTPTTNGNHRTGVRCFRSWRRYNPVYSPNNCFQPNAKSLPQLQPRPICSPSPAQRKRAGVRVDQTTPKSNCHPQTSPYFHYMPSRAKRLRQQPTWAEKLAWRWLRGRRFNGYKFRRQHPVGRYFVDFFCVEALLAIELDGSGHGHPEQKAHDAEREQFLQSLGIMTLRFWNHRLRHDRDTIRNRIFEVLQQRAPHPLPHYTRPESSQDSPSPRPSPAGRERV